MDTRATLSIRGRSFVGKRTKDELTALFDAPSFEKAWKARAYSAKVETGFLKKINSKQ